jgi:mannosyltransferase
MANFWPAVRGDVHPPLYYLIEWVNIRLLGSSEFAMRLPSAIFGLIAVWLIYRLTLAIGFERRVALLAGLFIAVLPAMIYYSQEARMYTLLLCCVLGAAWAAMENRWLYFGLCCLGAAYAQNLGVFYVAALGLMVLFIQIRRWRLVGGDQPNVFPLRPAIALALVFAGWLPWFFYGVLHQAQNMTDGFWMQPLVPGGLFEPIYGLTIFDRPAPPLTLAAYTAVAVMSAIGLIQSRVWLLKNDRGLIVLAVLVGGPALIALVSVVWRSVYLPRAMIASVALLAICWSYALFNLKRWDRLATLAVLVPALLVGVVGYYFPAQGARYPWADKIATIDSAWQPGDVVFYASINAAITLSYFFPPGTPYALRHEAGDLTQSLTPETQDAMQLRELEFDQLAAQGYKRAWFVVDINPMSSATEITYVDRVLGSYPHVAFIQYQQYQGTAYSKDSVYVVNLRRDF